MEIIGVIVAGIIIGVLGKFVAPSSQGQHPTLAHHLVWHRWCHHWLVRLYGVRWQRQPRDRLGPLAHRDRTCRGIGSYRIYGDRQD